MRIVALADTHLFQEDLFVPDGDVLVHAGDLLRAGTLQELKEGAAFLQHLPHRHKLLVAGNHEVCFQEFPAEARALLGPGITYLEDRGVTLEGVRFWGSPWQPAFNDWAFNLPRGAALAARWALVPDDTQVLVTHGPPRGKGDTTSTADREGCADLRRRVDALRPALHLFGHIHEDGGVFPEAGTVFVNCTTWECERGATVVDLVRDGESVRVHRVQVGPGPRR